MWEGIAVWTLSRVPSDERDLDLVCLVVQYVYMPNDGLPTQKSDYSFLPIDHLIPTLVVRAGIF